MLSGFETVIIEEAIVLAVDPEVEGAVPWNQEGRAWMPSFDVR
jgi:hypothetical protein